MPRMQKDQRQNAPGLVGLLADLEQVTQTAPRVRIGDLLTVLGARGHGPILLTLSSLMLLPTGMLPFMPAIMGALIAAMAFEMLIGDAGVSLPTRLCRIELNSAKLAAALRRAAPVSRTLGRLMHPRLDVLVSNRLSLTGIALILLVFAAIMIVTGAIPGLPFVLCIPALLFGLGLTAGDGVFVLLGYVTTGLAILAIVHLYPRISALWSSGLAALW